MDFSAQVIGLTENIFNQSLTARAYSMVSL
jgi:hypothetical protein